LRLALRSRLPHPGATAAARLSRFLAVTGKDFLSFTVLFKFLELLMPLPILKLLSFVLAWLACAPALAHEGHGLAGSHWHVTDAWGFAALGLGLVALVWFSKGGK
jgi:hypothetical protein